jgi:hypothetical protein
MTRDHDRDDRQERDAGQASEPPPELDRPALISRLVDSVGIAGIVVMALFALGIVVVLFASRREGLQTQAAMRAFAEDRGWSYAASGTEAFEQSLADIDSSARWMVANVVTVQDSPLPVRLFSYSASARQGKGTAHGTGVLVDAAGKRAARVIEILPRVPGVDMLVPDQVTAGTAGFRERFIVRSRAPDDATYQLTPQLEKILLEHYEGRGWHMTTRISQNRVLLVTSWARAPDDWDYLIRTARAIEEVIR